MRLAVKQLLSYTRGLLYSAAVIATIVGIASVLVLLSSVDHIALSGVGSFYQGHISNVSYSSPIVDSEETNYFQSGIDPNHLGVGRKAATIQQIFGTDSPGVLVSNFIMLP